MSLSAPPLRDKIPAKADAAGNVWIELPYAWQKWFSMIQQAMETIQMNYKDYETGATGNVKGIDGAMGTIDYLTLIGQGLVTGHTAFFAIGYNDDVDNVQEDIWESGGTYVFPPAGGIQMTVVSSDANDTAAGTGVRTVEINYLDANYAEATEVVTLNGVAGVNTVATNILRINYFHTVTAGSGGVAAGNITLKNTAGTVTYSQITATGNFARNGIFTVPAGKTAYLTQWDIGSGGASAGKFVKATLRATCDHNGVSTPGVFQFKRMGLCMDAGRNIPLNIPIKIPATADIKVSAIDELNAVVSTYFEGWIE